MEFGYLCTDTSTMNRITISSTIEEYADANELSAEDQELLRSARKAGESAYAPYSSFHVGAAVRLENGTIHIGNNQENVAYPSGLCAERVALFHVGAVYPEIAVTSIAITCSSTRFSVDQPLSPCGSCRQVMAESERRYGKPMRILLAGETGSVYVISGIKDLLPLSFEAEALKIK